MQFVETCWPEHCHTSVTPGFACPNTHFTFIQSLTSEIDVLQSLLRGIPVAESFLAPTSLLAVAEATCAQLMQLSFSFTLTGLAMHGYGANRVTIASKPRQ